jgi:hypothetical protein
MRFDRYYSGTFIREVYVRWVNNNDRGPIHMRKAQMFQQKNNDEHLYVRSLRTT